MCSTAKSVGFALLVENLGEKENQLQNERSQKSADKRPSDAVHSKKGLFMAVAKMATLGARMRAKPPNPESRGVPGGSRSRRGSLIFSYRDGSPMRRKSSIRDPSSEFELALQIAGQKRRRELMKKFRMWARITVMLSEWLKEYTHTKPDETSPFYTQLDTIERGLSTGIKDHYIFFDASEYKANTQMRMTNEAKRILSLPIKDRTESEIEYTRIALLGIKMIAEYPERIQRKLAKHGVFESYGPKRILVRQGRQPDNFYVILFGSVLVAVQDDCQDYAKTECKMSRGDSIGEADIINRTPRQSTVITTAYTEVLVLPSEKYEKIFMSGGIKTNKDPDHNRFIRGLSFLQGWPLHLLEENPRLFMYSYFRRQSVIVRDSNFSNWIIVVKSGSVRVMKKLTKTYNTLNPKTGKYRQVPGESGGYLDFMSRDSAVNRYALYHSLVLPPPLSPSGSDNDLGADDDDDFDGWDTHVHTRASLYHRGPTHRPVPLVNRLREIVRPQTLVPVSSTTPNIMPTQPRVKSWKSDSHVKIKPPLPKYWPGLRNKLKRRRASTYHPPRKGDADNDGTKTPDSVVSTGSKGILVGRKTFLEDLDAAYKLREHVFTEADMNPQFVIVHTMTRGDVFGLEHILFQYQPGLCLVSNGAECIMINKKLYRDQAPDSLLDRLQHELSPYPTDRDLQDELEAQVNWKVYKAITLHNVMDEKKKLHPEKHGVKCKPFRH
ncbi:hypothetical protein ScPMuIL_007515 [Solemya velum]